MKYFGVFLFILVSFAAYKPGKGFSSALKQNPSSRIINGANATKNQFPYMAHLVLHAFGETSECGGSIISENHILTAAHCLYLADYVTVYVGSNLRLGGKSFNVSNSNFIIHEEYDSQLNVLDIALIKHERLQFSDSIKPISLARTFDVNMHIGKQAQIMGWGETKDHKSLPDVLQFGSVRLKPLNACMRTGMLINEGNLCALPTLTEYAFLGDIGGPLVYESMNGTSIQIGIIPYYPYPYYSNKRLTIYYPFTNTSYFYNWIRDSILDSIGFKLDADNGTQKKYGNRNMALNQIFI